jgi:hypothetical protein
MASEVIETYCFPDDGPGVFFVARPNGRVQQHACAYWRR